MSDELPVVGDVDERELRFECTACGKCCTSRGEYAHVYLNRRESARLAAFLKLSDEEFERRYTFVDENGWRELRFIDEGCVFLGSDGLCGVYAARPIQCSTFPFWRELVDERGFTQEARELCEGVGRGEPWDEAEAERRMIEMELSDAEDDPASSLQRPSGQRDQRPR